MSDNVEYIDMGLEEIFAKVYKLDQTQVQVGVVGETAEHPTSDGRLTLGELAIINEYGTGDGHVPARHFMRAALEGNEAVQDAAKIAEAAIMLGDVDAAYHHVGRKLADRISNNIAGGDFDPNAQKTVAKKGFNQPLIDTSELLGAISHQLVRGSGDIVDAGGEGGDFEAFQLESGE